MATVDVGLHGKFDKVPSNMCSVKGRGADEATATQLAIGMGDRLRRHTATRVNLASYPQWDGQSASAKMVVMLCGWE